MTRSYDPHWQEPIGPGANTINFELSSREAVDATYERLVAAGYRGHLSPCDPPWQARFAIVDAPDGNIVGLHSPRDRAAERKREEGLAPERQPHYFKMFIATTSLLPVVHVAGAVQKVQPWTETAEMPFWCGLAVLGLLLYPVV